MNVCIFVGRMCADPEIKYTPNGVACCQFRIAVQRRFKNAQGVYEADFVQCVAWRQSAEFMNNYISKGDMVAVNGTLQTRSYEAQDGTKRYVTEIIVDNIQPCGGKKSYNAAPNTEVPPPQTAGEGFTEVDDDELPF